LGYMCYYHPNLSASMVCFRCGRRICVSCSKPYGEMTICPPCYHMAAMNQPAAPPAPTGPTLYAQGTPEGGVIYGPFPAKPQAVRTYSLLIVILLTAASVLIYANAQALLWEPFFSFWVSFFPWVSLLGPPWNFGFIFGIILSLVISGAIFMYMLGFRVLAAFMIFPAAILSLFIGGGFWAGLVLGVVTGIFMIMNGTRH